MGDIYYFNDKDIVIETISDVVVNFLCNIGVEFGCKNDVDVCFLRKTLGELYNDYSKNEGLNFFYSDVDSALDMGFFEASEGEFPIYKLSDFEDSVFASREIRNEKGIDLENKCKVIKFKPKGGVVDNGDSNK